MDEGAVSSMDNKPNSTKRSSVEAAWEPDLGLRDPTLKDMGDSVE